MPLQNLHKEKDRVWAVWQITEKEDELFDQISDLESIPLSLHHATKRLEFVAGRVLIKTLLASIGVEYEGMYKDEFGKPFLSGSDFHISLSHSYPYVAAVIDEKKNVGVDLEQPKEKLLRIAPRVMNEKELLDAEEDIVKHCIYWCAKEAMIKIYGKKDLTLAENLAVSPFKLENEGFIVGRIIVNGTVTEVPLFYQKAEDFTLVLSR